MTTSQSPELQWWVRVYRVGFAALILAAVIYQINTSPSALNFFSFFTIQSNLIAAAVLLVGATGLVASGRRWDEIRGGAMMYMLLTGIVYNTLLVGLEESLQTPAPWVNNVLHRVIPLVMLLDFLIVPLASRLTIRQVMWWMIYPLLYLVYTLIRGPIADWYPYPFLDPREDGGYGVVALYSLGIFIGFVVVTWLVIKLNDWRQEREGR